MNMKIQVRIGSLYLLNQKKKLINLLVLKILKVIYLGYKHTIQLCADIFV